MAEAHPVGFRWVMKAKERGATIIHVDPRFSRTSAMADLWVPIRAGSDITFFGALIRHIIETNQYFREYVVNYTNASNIISRGFPRHRTRRGHVLRVGGRRAVPTTTIAGKFEKGGDDPEGVLRDPTLEHPRCVFQTLRRHYQRYTPEMVQEVCGIPPELFQKVADAVTRNSGPERTMAQCYAVGYTHQSKGVQIIRSVAVMQLLLGNIGRPGGGILALRGHASIQGSTDIPTLYDTLPGYLSMPAAAKDNENLAAYLKKYTQADRPVARHAQVHDQPAQGVLRQARDEGKRLRLRLAAQAHGDHSHFEFVMRMCDHEVDGYFIMGQNPAVGSQNARLQRQSLARVKWLVVRDPRRDRERVVLVRRPGDRARRDENRGHRHGSVPHARRLARPRRRARSPTPSACSSGARKPSSRRATPRARRGSPTNSPNG